MDELDNPASGPSGDLDLLDSLEITTGHHQHGQATSEEAFADAQSEIPARFYDPDEPTPCAFITGKAGVGKSTLLRERCDANPRYAVLSASTGIAAINLNTVTIHSLLGFFDTDSLRDAYIQGQAQKRLRRVAEEGFENVVVDECSMISKDVLDILVRIFDDVNTNRSLNGEPPVGLILTGDACQLPPIADRPAGHQPSRGRRAAIPPPWCFDSQFWPRFAKNTTHLTKVWRQADPRFLAALDFARSGRGRDCVQVLQSCGQRFESAVDLSFKGTTVVGKNDEVDRLNQIRLDREPGRKIALPSRRWAVGGRGRPEWKNVPERTILREGCYVMILANQYAPADGGGKPQMVYANGDCGWVRGIEPSETPGVAPAVMVELVRTGEIVFVRSLVRDISFADKPEWVSGEWDQQAQDEDGRWIGKQHYRKAKRRWVTGQIEYFPLRLAYASTVHKCVDANELVPIEGGLIPIKKMRVGDITPFGSIVGKAESYKPAIRIRTKMGYEIRCSEEHRWDTSRGLLETREIVPGDNIALARPTLEISSVVPPPVSDELAWVIGALIGDGSYTDRDDGTIHYAAIREGKRALAERFRRYILGPELDGIAPPTRKCSWRKDGRGVHTSQIGFRRKLAGLGLDYVRGAAKTTPWAILQGNSRTWGSYLQGLFDTDGCVRGCGLVFCSVSADIAKHAQLLLLYLGIPSHRGRYRVKYKGEYRYYWHVRLTAAYVGRFATLVGFSNPEKVEQLHKLLCARKRPEVQKFNDGWDEVAEVTRTGESVPMVDVEVGSRHHMMNFGPFWGHNCQGLSLDRVQVDIRTWNFKMPAMTYVALSRARTLEGLRLVGTPELLAERCRVDPKVTRWL